MRVLLAGAWQWPWYEEACATVLGDLGHEVMPFSWFGAFFRSQVGAARPEFRSRSLGLQYRLLAGPRVDRINRDLVKMVEDGRPDMLLLYRAPMVQASALKAIKRRHPSLILTEYCNDDPFSPAANALLWRHLKRSIPVFDIHFVFRSRNLQDFRHAGARRVHMLRGYYVPWFHHPVDPDTQDPRFACDVAFAGHYERDWRIKALARLAATNAGTRLYGAGWDRASSAEKRQLGSLLPTSIVAGEDYRQAVCGARIGLCFLSSLNRDTYTTRSFEIPAMGVFLLSQYTSDLASLFEEGREIAFFRTPDELLTKVAYYLEHEDERRVMARNGRERVRRDGHDVTSRMREMMSVIETMS